MYTFIPQLVGGFFMQLTNKKILLGVSGSIAAYKATFLVRLLIKQGAQVKVIMTNAAKDFVTPLSLSTLSKNDVLSDIATKDSWANHVALGRWADVMLIAPLSCNTLAKMATGLCDNLLMAVYLSATCPVIVAPAMDEDMWHHPTTKNNLQKLEVYHNKITPVENGELASGLIGEGRMAEPEIIVKYLEDFFISKDELKGKKILVTAGPTYEAIDPVRFIGNHSSGKMGIALAEELTKRGGDVTLVIGPSSEKISSTIKVEKVTSAAEMYEACMVIFEKNSKGTKEIKFGCGMHTLYSKSFWELVGIPESFGGYGPEDTYGMSAATLAIRMGYDIKQFVIDGVYITEDYTNRTPSFDGKIVPIDKKKEFYDKANALGQQEVINFAKRLIEKQSNL